MSLFTQEDVATFRKDRLMRLAASLLPGIEVTDDYLLGKLQASAADVARKLRVNLEPTAVFPYTPSAEEIAELDGMPWLEEAGYDYDPEFFRGERWGFMVLRHKPIISVEWVRFAYPSPTKAVYELPKDWLRPDKKAGTLNFVPTSASISLPLNAFVMQAMGGGATIPFMLQVRYVAGLQGVKCDPRWADLLDVIYKSAALKVIEDEYLPQSGSISADGLSQSMTVDIEKYHDGIDTKLFGGKGANGGLWTSIHGIVMGAVG